LVGRWDVAIKSYTVYIFMLLMSAMCVQSYKCLTINDFCDVLI